MPWLALLACAQKTSVNEECFNPGFTARHPCTGALTRSPEPGKYEARQQVWFTSLIDAFERTIIRVHDWLGSRFGSGSVKPDGCLGVTLGPSGCERARERERGEQAGREGCVCGWTGGREKERRVVREREGEEDRLKQASKQYLHTTALSVLFNTSNIHRRLLAQGQVRNV